MGKISEKSASYETRMQKGKTRMHHPSSGEETRMFPERLKIAIGTESVRSFARRCELSETAVRAYLAGKSEPTRPAIIAMARKAGVSPGWLLDGGEPMHPEEPKKTQITPDEFALIPLYDVEASAGHGAVVEGEDVKFKLAFRRDWLQREGFSGHPLAVITARGDSMEPTINEGDSLLIEAWISPDGRQIHTPGKIADGIYIIRMDNDLVVKRLQSDFQGGVIIRSDNPAYENIHVPPEKTKDLKIVGKVVWIGRRI